MSEKSGEKSDDLEAVRVVVSTLQPFKSEERERILRWALEKLGMSGALGAHHVPPPASLGVSPGAGVSTVENAAGASPMPTPNGTDIKSFVGQKAPQSDVQFAAVVAYFHQFVAPPALRKDSISKEDIVDACRKVTRKQSKRIDQLLVNTYQAGYFDRGESGRYKLNAVGENLVTMTLPGGSKVAAASRRKKRTRKSGSARTAPRKKARAANARSR